MLIVLLLTALIPALKALGVIPKEQKALKIDGKDIALTISLLLNSVQLILLYIYWLADVIKSWNIKLL